MPIDDRHRAQKRKNYLWLALLVGIMLMFYALTIVRIGGGFPS